LLNIPDFEHGVLEIEVMDKDLIGEDDKLGKVHLKLVEELKPNHAVEKVLHLPTKGEIHVEFEYNPL